MSVSLAKLSSSALLLALLSGTAAAETAPLALPPAEAAQAAAITPPPPTAPAMGLALPPSTLANDGAASTATSAPTAIVPAAASPAPVPAPVAANPQPVAPVAEPAPVAAVSAPAAATATTATTNPAPVEAAPLQDVKPDSNGLLASHDGGLGAGLWKGTSRRMVERFMQIMPLPVPYPTLNNLASRMLLTTAEAPEGDESTDTKKSFAALRVAKLLALGNAAEAWNFATIAGLDHFDEDDVRTLAENALVSAAAADACTKMPTLIQKHTSMEWQRLMVVCQLQAADNKAAQVTLDLMHAQGFHDDSFFALAEKNIIAGNKQLPRRLTPLQPVYLALMRLTDLPVRSEVYARPDASLIPELLKTKAEDESSRLALAERAAVKGLIDDKMLAKVYDSQNFAPEALINAPTSGERGPMARALWYQASQAEKDPRVRVVDALQFMNSLDATSMGPAVLSLLGHVIGDIKPEPSYYEHSAQITKIYTLAGKTANALAWLDLTRDAARGMPQVRADLENLWPVLVFGGLESEKDFPAHLNAWVNGSIKDAAQPDAESKAQKQTVASLLLLMDALGFTVTDEAWSKAMDSAQPEKMMMPSALIMNRLRSAASGNRKGEVILTSLLASAGGKEEPPVLADIEIIHALRAAGFAAEAGTFTQDVALRIMNPPVKF